MAFMTVEQRKRYNRAAILIGLGTIPVKPAPIVRSIMDSEEQSEESKREALRRAEDKRKTRAMKRIHNFHSSRKDVSC